MTQDTSPPEAASKVAPPVVWMNVLRSIMVVSLLFLRRCCFWLPPRRCTSAQHVESFLRRHTSDMSQDVSQADSMNQNMRHT
jgi:hypothetical protein